MRYWAGRPAHLSGVYWGLRGCVGVISVGDTEGILHGVGDTGGIPHDIVGDTGGIPHGVVGYPPAGGGGVCAVWGVLPPYIRAYCM